MPPSDCACDVDTREVMPEPCCLRQEYRHTAGFRTLTISGYTEMTWEAVIWGRSMKSPPFHFEGCPFEIVLDYEGVGSEEQYVWGIYVRGLGVGLSHSYSWGLARLLADFTVRVPERGYAREYKISESTERTNLYIKGCGQASVFDVQTYPHTVEVQVVMTKMVAYLEPVRPPY